MKSYQVTAQMIVKADSPEEAAARFRPEAAGVQSIDRETGLVVGDATLYPTQMPSGRMIRSTRTRGGRQG